MAYTQAFDTTNPGNAEVVSQGAARIRALARDVRERLAATFVNVDADPLVLRATSLPASFNVNAGWVQPGTFSGGVGDTYSFPGPVAIAKGATVGGGLVVSEVLRSARLDGGSVSGTVNNVGQNTSAVRYTVTGTTTFNLASGTAGQELIVEVLQDASGGRSYSFASPVWTNGIAPSYTTVPNRKAVFVFYHDGAGWLGGSFGENFASAG